MAEAMAVLGGLSSVFQIVDFTAKLAKCATQLIRSADGAIGEVEEIDRLASEYTGLAAIILNANARRTDDSDFSGSTDLIDSRHIVIEHAKSCQAQAKGILKSIEDFRKPEGRGLKRYADGGLKAARYVMKKEKLEKDVKRLQDKGALLHLALQTAAGEKPRSIRKMIISALEFEEIHSRERNIEEAHEQTYQWALDSESFGIRSWLSSESSTFWVTGKPGSGKSTFMKFLATDSRTEDYLREWAQDSELIIARFYFWYLGSPMQTSTEGLLRSILCQIFREFPALTKVAFPAYFELTGKPVRPPEFTYKDLLKAVRKLASSMIEADTQKKLCLFIDGLDEFRGDHIELIELLGDLGRRYAIKMLISSRDWTVFSRAYEGIVPHLRLEELTKDDIHLYVYNRVLNAASSSRRLSGSRLSCEHGETLELINDIVERAEGVFLWTFLVVREVRRGIAEDDSISMLRHRVSTFPPDLNKFFKELIYDRVDEAYAKQRSQALVMAMLCVQQKTKLTALVSYLDYWLMLRSPTGFEDTQFPFQWSPLPDLMYDAQHAECAKKTRRFLSSTCKDLLTIDRTATPSDETRVTFLHRTVYDFLRTPAVYDLLVSQAPPSVISGWIFHLLAWSKLNLLHHKVAATGSGIALIDAALSTPHPKLSDSFVERIMRCIQPQSLRVGPGLSSRAVHTLAAYQKNDLVRSCFVWTMPSNNNIEDCVATGLLGTSPVRQFGRDQINVELLTMAVAFINDVRNVHLPTEDDPECCNNSWQLLLKTFHEECNRPDQRHLKAREKLQHAIKIYLSAGAPLSQLFCTTLRQSGLPHVHKWCEARDFVSLFSDSRPDKQSERPG